MKTLETERLILRNWQATDLDDFYEYASVEGVGEMAGWPHHTDKEFSKTILQNFIEEDEVYALVLKENNKVIGSLGIHNRERNNNEEGLTHREIGYVLSKDYWGKGLMVEAVKATIVYVFDELQIEVLWCGHYNFNTQSARVIEKCGFTFHSNEEIEAKLLNKTFTGKKYVLKKVDFK